MILDRSAESGRNALLLRILDDGYDRQKAWHGPPLRSSIRRVKVEEAAWRPAPDQRNIWEITLHSAYWKYTVWRWITGTERGSFPREGSDWFARPDPPDLGPRAAARQWRKDVALLDEYHHKVRELVESLSGDALDRQAAKDLTVEQLIASIAAHDLYHAGQVQTLKRLFGGTDVGPLSQA